MPCKSHILVLQLLGHIPRTRARNFDPSLGEEGTGGDNEGDVDDGVEGVLEGRGERMRSGHVVGDTGDGAQLSRVVLHRLIHLKSQYKLHDHLKGTKRYTYLPNAQKTDEQVVRESTGKHLTDEEDVASQSALEHDRHVGSVEKLDGVSASLASHLGALDGDFDSETLEVNHSSKDSDGREEVHNVWKTITVEGFLESAGLVIPSEQEVKEGDDGTFKLGSTTSVDSVGGKGFPNDRFTNVGSYEKGDTGTKTVTLGEQFIKEDDDQRGRNELENKEKTDTRPQRGGRAVKTGQDVNSSLTKGNNHGEHCDPSVATLVRKTDKKRVHFWAAPNKARSSLRLKSTSIN